MGFTSLSVRQIGKLVVIVDVPISGILPRGRSSRSLAGISELSIRLPLVQKQIYSLLVAQTKL
jgi:hypothetical protein